MSLDLEAIKRRVEIGFAAYADGKAPTDVTDRAALIAEVERLREELDGSNGLYAAASADNERLREALLVTVAALSLGGNKETHDNPNCGFESCSECWALETAREALGDA